MENESVDFVFVAQSPCLSVCGSICIAGIADVRFVVQRDQRAENTQSTHTVCDQENWLWLFLQKVIFSVAPCE